MVEQFNPSFTYPIFGQEEAVFGYKGLEILLHFAAHNLKPHVDISWEEQWEQKGDIKASDVRAALEDFLPAEAFTDASRPTALSDSEASSFTPPGEKIMSYRVKEETFEIWCTSLADPAAQEIMDNAQVLVPLFIEGGTELQLDQPWVNQRWKVFLLYQVTPKSAGTCPYSLIGFSTSYRVFTLPDRVNPSAAALSLLEGSDFDAILDLWSADNADKSAAVLQSPLDLPSRERISQFLILPPYQRSGHGPQLYNAMYSHLVAPENILELTVEDPNEAFDDMRDACDLNYLRENNSDFASLKINTNLDATKMKSDASIPVDDIILDQTKQQIKATSKIMPRQLARLLEMQTLSKIPQTNRNVARISRKEKSSNENDRAYYFWRLYVKQRLYETHKDSLSEMDPEERIEKLEDTVNTVQDDYDRLLALADKYLKRTSSGSVMTINQKRKDRKRKTIVDDDDDEDGNAPQSADGKKRRISTK